MDFTLQEIMQTVSMTVDYHFDIRTVTMGVNLKDCRHSDINIFCRNIKDKIAPYAEKLIKCSEKISAKYGIPIINKRISITPLSLITEGLSPEEGENILQTLEEIASTHRIDFIGGIGILADKAMTRGEKQFLPLMEKALTEYSHLCGFINVASTHAGINMDAVIESAGLIHRVSRNTPDGVGCAKLVVFANAPEDNPFMAGAFHGTGEGDYALNVGISGPGVIQAVLTAHPYGQMQDISERIKQTVFKLTRCGDLIGREIAKMMGIDFGIVDLSLAPTTEVGDSVAGILEAMGLESVGIHGSTAAVFLLINAVKKGGVMAGAAIGGLSGTFIPVSEDIGMVQAIQRGTLSLDKLEALTSVCSVGLDMVLVPGDIAPSTLAAIIADEAAIGISNNKTVGVRIIPVPGKKAGEYVRFGGLLGESSIMPITKGSPEEFIKRGGFIPPSITSFNN